MPHQSLDLRDYHEGDAKDIHVPLLDRHDEPITTDSTWEAEFLLKNDPIDDDADAILTKHTDDGDVTLEQITQEDVDRVDAVGSTDGDKVVIDIATGDTDGVLGTGDTRVEQDTFHYRVRVWNADGDRMTVVHGDFLIHV